MWGVTLDSGCELRATSWSGPALVAAETLPSHPIPHPDTAGTAGAAETRASSAAPGPVAGRPRQAVPGVPGGAQPNPTKHSPGKHSSRDHDGIMVGTVPLLSAIPRLDLSSLFPELCPAGTEGPQPPSQVRKEGSTALWHLLLPGPCSHSPLHVEGGRGSPAVPSCSTVAGDRAGAGMGGSGEIPVSGVRVPEPVDAQVFAPPG